VNGQKFQFGRRTKGHVQINFRNPKFAITLRGMSTNKNLEVAIKLSGVTAKNNREAIFDASLSYRVS
jgi:hypothetical protein